MSDSEWQLLLDYCWGSSDRYPVLQRKPTAPTGFNQTSSTPLMLFDYYWGSCIRAPGLRRKLTASTPLMSCRCL
jgi:hypothetical protein